MVTMLEQRCDNWLNLEYIVVIIRNDDKSYGIRVSEDEFSTFGSDLSEVMPFVKRYKIYQPHCFSAAETTAYNLYRELI